MEKVFLLQLITQKTKKSLICGCNTSHIHNKDQIQIILRRILEPFNFKFVGFEGDPEIVLASTRCIIECPVHGVVGSKSTINSLRHFKRPRCRLCSNKIRTARILSDEEIIESFIERGKYSQGTLFWEEKHPVWAFLCSDCNQKGRGLFSDVRNRNVSCGCVFTDQTQLYLNFISDNDVVMGIKFGVSSKPHKRVYTQNSKSVYDVKLFGIWSFNTKQECRATEKLIKNSVEGNLLSRNEFKDGYTETTNIKNLDKILEILYDSGGVKLI